MKIYLDHSATTPVDKEVAKAMQPYFSDIFGNPSSLHSFGQEAARAVDEARETVARFLNCDFEEIIFTSGATEADNLAIQGTLNSVVPSLSSEYNNSDLKVGATGSSVQFDKPHIITTSIEHPAVLEVCRELEKRGTAEVSYVKPKSDGVVRVSDIEKEIKDNTVLISVMYVNNEIGTIQQIREIGGLVKKVNMTRVARDSSSPDKRKRYRGPRNDIPLLFHTDAVQATLYCEMDVKKLGVDLLSLSGHKIYGPKGIGVLYVKKGTPIKPIQFGGHHEFGLRPGTLNTPLIVGFGKAIELIINNRDIKSRDNKTLSANSRQVKNLRDYLWQQIQKNISDVKLNGSLENRTPNNLNISIAGVEGEALLLGLDLSGIAISTGSACSSGSLKPSHVLMAMGMSHEDAHGSLRITLGKDNTKQEMDYLVEKLKEVVLKYRKMAPKL